MKDKETTNYILILILASLLLFSFHIYRFRNMDSFPFYESYRSLNPDDALKSGAGNFEDLLEKAAFMTDLPFFILRIVPILIGLICIVLMEKIYRKVIQDDIHKNLALLITILSPLFLYTFGVPSKYALPVMFILIGIYLILLNAYLVALLSFLAGFFFNQNIFLALLLCLIALMDRSNSKIRIVAWATLILTLVLFGNLSSRLIGLPLENIIRDYMPDFGGEFGFGAFALVLFVFGLILVWKEKDAHMTYLISIFVILYASMFDKGIIIIADIIMAYFAGVALKNVIKRDWVSPMLKSYVIILIFCGLVFSSGSFIKKSSESGPYPEELESLLWLRNRENGVVLSDYRYGYLINSQSGMQSYVDKDYFIHSKDRSRIKTADSIFKSRNLEEIARELKNNKIRYIWINSRMKTGQVWNKADEGILLILPNSKSFRKIYSYKGVDIWEVSKEA